MTPTDLADVLDAIAKQPAVPLRDIRGELRQAAQMLRDMAEALRPFALAAEALAAETQDGVLVGLIQPPTGDRLGIINAVHLRRARRALGSQP